MRINSISTTLYRVPPATPWEDSTHRVSGLEYLVLDLSTDEGLTGVGLSYTIGVGGTALKALIDDYCTGLVIGKDPRDFERVASDIAQNLHRTGTGGINTLAAAAIDIAVWDTVSRADGLPLYRRMGGARDSIPAYASGIDFHLAPQELRQSCAGYVAAGYEAVKIKVGRPRLGEDLARIEAAREALGDERLLLLDANQAWRVDEAVRRCAAFEEFDPFWIEEPLDAEDVEGHAHLRRSTRIPIALGESLYSKHEFLAYLQARAVDIIQPDICRVGGFTQWLKIAHLAEAWEVGVAPHFLVELSVHGLCAVSNGVILENVGGGSLDATGLAPGSDPVANGTGSPSQRPGHGVELDRVAAAEFMCESDEIQQTDTRMHG